MYMCMYVILKKLIFVFGKFDFHKTTYRQWGK